MKKNMAGFTMVELVVVIVLLGILAAYAAPRFAGRGGYSELTAQQDLKQSIRFAQQLAMSRTDRSITLTTVAKTATDKATISVSDNGSPALNYPKQLPDDITLSNATLTFNRLGSVGSVNQEINVIGSVQTRCVRVQGTTGYAQDC